MGNVRAFGGERSTVGTPTLLLLIADVSINTEALLCLGQVGWAVVAGLSQIPGFKLWSHGCHWLGKSLGPHHLDLGKVEGVPPEVKFSQAHEEHPKRVGDTQGD